MAPDINKEFPLLSQYTYANIAASGLMYERLMDWRQEHDLDFLIKGSIFREKHHVFIEEIRATVGQFFGCRTENVSLIPNFSFGFNTFLEGIDKGKKVLLLQNDYPSVNEAVENRGFKTCYAVIDENLESNIKEAIRNEKPDILALSLVQYINGIKVDLDFLKNLKSEYPELIIVADGTQFCGIEAFDFETSGIDILGASAYKWLLAGYGCGFMMFKEDCIRHIYPNTFENLEPVTFSKTQEHLMRYFEPGHQDTLNYGSLKFSLDFLREIGVDKIQEQLEILSSRAKEELTQLNALEDAVVKRTNHSTIFNIKGDDALFKKLTSNGIICSQRGSGIRLSFHFFNTEKDINRIVQLLRKELKET
ncbi:aminotransferase class V-fold PLP-dependent enzyme [Flavobacteriaceae bacterium R38]|nr:aminotransferase class V-fold PLP-dependent enzyme [Flavobacteriaceae bacterium R38]